MTGHIMAEYLAQKAGYEIIRLIWLAAESVLDFVCMASFLFPFYVDELTTVTIRMKDGENLTKPHRRHYYQLLANEKRIAPWKVSVGYGVFPVSYTHLTLPTNREV